MLGIIHLMRGIVNFLDQDFAIPKEEDSDYDLLFWQVEAWKLKKIEMLLGLKLKSSYDLKEEAVTIDAVKKFLSHCVEGDYSWLISEILSSRLQMEENLSEELCEGVGIQWDLLHKIFELLWDDCDWEKFDIKDELFIAKTIKGMVQDLRNGLFRDEIKKHILQSIVEIFSFNEENSKNPWHASDKNTIGICTE